MGILYLKKLAYFKKIKPKKMNLKHFKLKTFFNVIKILLKL